MGRGFLTGMTWGALVGVISIALASQLTDRRDLASAPGAGTPDGVAGVAEAPPAPEAPPGPAAERAVSAPAPSEAAEATAAPEPLPAVEPDPEPVPAETAAVEPETEPVPAEPAPAAEPAPEPLPAETAAAEPEPAPVEVAEAAGAPTPVTSPPAAPSAAGTSVRAALPAPTADRTGAAASLVPAAPFLAEVSPPAPAVEPPPPVSVPAPPDAVAEPPVPDGGAGAPVLRAGGDPAVRPGAPPAVLPGVAAPPPSVPAAGLSAPEAPAVIARADVQPSAEESPRAAPAAPAPDVPTPDAPPSAGAPAAPPAEAPAAEAPAQRAPEPGFRSAAGVRVNRLPTIGGDAPAPEPEPEAESAPESDAPRPALLRHAVPFETPVDRPLIAVVLIHDGAAAPGADTGLDLPVPVSFALDAGAPQAGAIAAAYRAGGREVLIVPTLPQGARPSDVEVALGVNLDTIPEAVALMDSPDGGFQSEREATAQVVAAASATGHGIVSFPRGLNAAQQMAERAGVPARVVFRVLDAEDTGAAMRTLDQAAFRARQEGVVILAGQAEPATVAAIRRWVEANPNRQVTFAPVSAALTAE